MNKLLTKIVGAALGLSMTVGVGVAVAVNNNSGIQKAEAASSTITFSSQGWSNSSTHNDFTLSGFRFLTGGSGTNTTYYTSDSTLRYYNGRTLTITPTNANWTLSSVTSDPSKTFTVTSSSATISFSATVKFKSITITYEEDSGSSFEPEHSGTSGDPYTVADARGCIDANTGVTNVYATGIVSEIVTAYSSQYGNITFNISSDGLTSSDQLEAYRATGAEAANIALGDTVVVKGNLTKYNATYEFASGCEIISRTPKTISSISVKTAPSKTTYYAGDYFDPTGLVITATTNIGTEDVAYADHSSDFSFTPATNVALSTTDTSVTITYGGKSTNQAITVNAARTMTSIVLHGTIEKTAYFVGDSWDLSGLDIQVNWSTGDPTFVAFDDESVVYECSPATATGTSITSFDIEVLYASFDETFTVDGITVSAAPSVATFDLSTDQTKTATISEMSWDSTHVAMLAEKHNASTNTNNYYPGTSGHSYTSTRFYSNSKLTISPKSGVEIIKVVYTATTSAYATALGNSDWTNATTVTKSDAEPFTVTITPNDGTAAFYAIVGATTGATSVEISYYAKALTEITWSGTPVSPQYVGDDFDYSGLTFTAHYSDSTTAQIPGSDITWSPLVAGNNPVGSFGGVNFAISGVTVLNNILESIAISGDMTKRQYKAGGTWDPTGLVVTATFSKGPQVVTGDVEWSYSPSAPAADTTSVIVTASYTSGGVTKTDSTSAIPITIQETEGLLKSGYYYITATNESAYYLPQGEFTAGSAANNPHATVYDADVYGLPYYFNLIDDNTYTISFVNGSSETCYLNVANDNSGAKVTALESITEACKWTLSTNGAGHYKLVANDGTNDRYLALYNTQDWRTYKTNSTSGINVLDIISENDKFAVDFKDTYTASCNAASGTYTSLAWAKAKAHFDSLHDSSEFVSAQYTISGSGTSTVVTKSGDTRQVVAEAAAKYDYIVGKYGEATFEDFMSRNPDPIGSAKTSSLYYVNPNNAVAIISIIAVLSLSAVAGYFMLRKRKEQ